MYAYIGSRTTRERNARGDDISIFRVDSATGRLTLLNRQHTGGRNSVHLALSPVVVSNDVTSSLAVLPLRADSNLGEH